MKPTSGVEVEKLLSEQIEKMRFSNMRAKVALLGNEAYRLLIEHVRNQMSLSKEKVIEIAKMKILDEEILVFCVSSMESDSVCVYGEKKEDEKDAPKERNNTTKDIILSSEKEEKIEPDFCEKESSS